VKRKVTIEGSNPDGRIIGSDIRAIALDLDPDAPVKARTTMGGWIKSLEVEVLGLTAPGPGTGTGDRAEGEGQ
jgi:hypothetical protein